MPNKKYYTQEDRDKSRRLWRLKQSDKEASRDRKGSLERHTFRGMLINLIEQDLGKSEW